MFVHYVLETRDETRYDAMSNCVETETKKVCKFEKPIEKSNNVGNEGREKLLIQLVEAVIEVRFLLKCVNSFVVFFRSVLLAKN